MLYIGIDLSDKFFDSCIINECGDVLNRDRFDSDHDGFCSLMKLIQELCQELQTHQHECIIGLENPRSRLVDFLTQRGYTVVLTQPNTICSYRKSRTPSGAKSDQADAQLIADYVREHHRNLRSISVADGAIRELSLLLEDRDRPERDSIRSTDGNIFRSLPEADYILGGKLLVLYSTRDFRNASEAQQLFGTAPYTSASGQSRYVGFRKGASKLGRNTFQQLARGSIRSSSWARIQYVKKRNQGKSLHHAFRCLANTWVKITFAMWCSKTPYDEDKHLASITRHMINQPAFANNG